MEKALIAMSGGVDSSLAAKLMQEAGYECIGCTMKLHDNYICDVAETDDIADAQKIAAELNIPFHVFDFREDFCEQVIARFVGAYEQGITPNPCIDCNRYMKFGKLYECAIELGCQYVVTGHYAIISQEGDRYYLKKATDASKDQSYVLYSLTQEQLAHTRFPLGGMTKSAVRDLAFKSAFVNANKPDSQDICFVPDGDYAAFLERHTGRHYAPGDYIDAEGHVLGQHRGTVHYTIGQRKGLGIALGQPMFVTALDPAANTVTLGSNEDLFQDTLEAQDFNWISGQAPCDPIRCKAKIRYRQTEQPAMAYPIDSDHVRVVFDEAQRAITPGQSVVLYDGDYVLGGGKIL